MNYVEQLYSTNIKLRAFEDALAETMVLIQIFVTFIFSFMYNSHVFSNNPLSRVNIFVTISCRGRVVTNVVSTCDPTPLYYICN